MLSFTEYMNRPTHSFTDFVKQEKKSERTFSWGRVDPEAERLLAEQGITGVSPAGRAPFLPELGAPRPKDQPGITTPPQPAEPMAPWSEVLIGSMGPVGAAKTLAERMKPTFKERVEAPSAFERLQEPKPSPEVAPLARPEPKWSQAPAVPLGRLLPEGDRGAVKAVLDVAGSLTAPENAALLMAASQLSRVPVVGPAAGRATSGAFGAMMFKGALQDDPEWTPPKDSKGDIWEDLLNPETWTNPVNREIITRKALEVGLGGLATGHATGAKLPPSRAEQAKIAERYARPEAPPIPEIQTALERVHGFDRPAKSAEEAARTLQETGIGVLPALGKSAQVSAETLQNMPPLPQQGAPGRQLPEAMERTGQLGIMAEFLPEQAMGRSPNVRRLQRELGPVAPTIPLRLTGEEVVRRPGEPPPLPEGVMRRAELGDVGPDITRVQEMEQVRAKLGNQEVTPDELRRFPELVQQDPIGARMSVSSHGNYDLWAAKQGIDPIIASHDWITHGDTVGRWLDEEVKPFFEETTGISLGISLRMPPEAGSAPMLMDLANMLTRKGELDVNKAKELKWWGAARLALGRGSRKGFDADFTKRFGKEIKPHLDKIWGLSVDFFENQMRATSDRVMQTTRELLQAYEKGRPIGEDWWKNSAAEIDQRFGPDAKVFKQFIAATSPQHGIMTNLDFATEAYIAWKTGQPFNQVRSRDTGGILFTEQTVKRLNKIANGRLDWSEGPKVRAMESNLLGDESVATIDRWIARIFGYPESFTRARYRLMDYAITQAAEQRRVTPAELQAGLWAWIKEEAKAAGEADWTSANFRTAIRDRLKQRDPRLFEALNLLPSEANIRLYHWSRRPDVAVLDPSHYGEGKPGAENVRRLNNAGAFADRTYFTNKPVPPEKEFGPGTPRPYLYSAEVPRESVYNLAQDPMHLREKAGGDITQLESLIREEGFWGYQAGDNFAIFEPRKVFESNIQPIETQVPFELAFGDGSPLSQKFQSLYELPYEVSMGITREATEPVIQRLAEDTGVEILDTGYGPGVYADYPAVPSGHLRIRGAKDAIENFQDALGLVLQQTDVPSFAPVPRGAGKVHGLVFKQEGGTQLADPAFINAYWAKLRELHPDLEGASPAAGPGLLTIDFADKWTPEKVIALGEDATNIAREMGITVKPDIVDADIIRKGNDWNVQGSGQTYRDSLSSRGRSDLLPRLDDHARWVEETVEQAFRKYTGTDGRRVEGNPEAGFLGLDWLADLFRGKKEEKPKLGPALPPVRTSYVRSVADIKVQSEKKGLEPRLSANVAKTIASDIPAETLDKMDPPEQQRVMFQIADMIAEDPTLVPAVPELLQKYSLTEAQMAEYLRDAASKSGRTLGAFGWIGKELRKTFKDPQAKAVLENLKDPDTSPWKWTMQKFQWLENIRLASLVSQVKTAVRNAYTQTGNLSIKVFEDAVDGVLNLPRKDSNAAFGRLIEDVHSLGRVFARGGEKLRGEKGPATKALDELLSIDDIKTARMLSTPMLDVSLGQKYARALTVLNRFQETAIRKMAFDASLRGELRRMGHDPSGPMGNWRIPKEDITKALDVASEEALRITWAQTPKKGLAKAILEAYQKVPLLRLVQPFPRFYFGNAMGWIFQHSPGALMSPKVWKAARSGDYRPLVRAGVGIAMLGWATAYRARDDSPGQWYKVRVLGKEIDSRPFAPILAPYLLLGELILDQIRQSRGEVPRIDIRDVTGMLLGMNRIAGTGLAIVDAALDNRGSLEWRWRQLKEVAGSYVGGFLVPLLQIRDVIAQFDPEERIYRDTRGSEFTGQILRQIPIASRRLPEMPAVTRPGSVKAEAPLLSQLTGILPKQSTFVETELSKLGVSWRDIVPQVDGPPDVERKAKQYLGDMINGPMESLFKTEQYQNSDDALRKEMVSKVLGALRNAAARRAEAEGQIRRTLRIERNRGAPRHVPIGTPPPPPRRIRPVNPPPAGAGPWGGS